MSFETQVPVQVLEEGETTVYCDKFMGILTSLPSGEIEFNQPSDDTQESINVTIRPLDKKIKFQMKTMAQDKYPEVNISDNAPYFEIPSKEFKAMIGETVFAVSEDETRYFMNGVFFEKNGDKLNLVATDGRRLSFASKEILSGVADFPSAIVHPKILGIVLKHAPEEGNISLAIVDKMVYIKFGNYKFGSVLLEGNFPNYRRVIPETQEHKFSVLKSDFVSALKRVALMVDKKAGRMYLDITPGMLKITSNQSELGSADEEIPCEYADDEMVIAFNYRYIEEPLRVIGTERIVFEFTADMKAVTMRPEPEGDYFHIIMPMQKE